MADATKVESPPTPPATDVDAPNWAVLPVVLAPTFMVTLDMFIVNVAVPSIQQDLNAGSAAVQMFIAGISLAVAATLITAGRLGDMYGRRRMFTIGLILFTLASAGCGLAPNSGELIAGRVAQGIAAGLMMPQVLAIITITFTGAHRVKAFSAYGLAMGFAGVFGQLIGGALISADIFGSGWRSIFLINVPIGLVALLFTRRVLPESRGSGKTRLDLFGVLLVSAGLVGVIYPLVRGREEGWPAWTWITLASALVVLVLFFVYQHALSSRDGAPLINTAMFGERAFPVGLLTSLLFYGTMSSFFLVLALYLQHGRELSAFASGCAFVPMGLGFFAASVLSKGLALKLGRQVLAVGAIVLAVGLALTEFEAGQIDTTGGLGWIIAPLVIAGFGMGMVLAPLSSTVLASIPMKFAAAASGVLSTAIQVGTAVGVAIVGNVFYDKLGATVSRQAFVDAFTFSTVVLVVVSVAIAIAVQFLPKPVKAG